MKKVLFVNCCIRREGSRTQKLADHFLEGLRKKEGYEIEELCLMDESLSYFTDLILQMDFLSSGNVCWQISSSTIHGSVMLISLRKRTRLSLLHLFGI